MPASGSMRVAPYSPITTLGAYQKRQEQREGVLANRCNPKHSYKIQVCVPDELTSIGKLKNTVPNLFGRIVNQFVYKLTPMKWDFKPEPVKVANADRRLVTGGYFDKAERASQSADAYSTLGLKHGATKEPLG